jgi:elongation factor P
MTARDYRKGNVFNYESELWLVMEAQTITPGNWRGYTQIRARSLRSGNTKEFRFRSTEDVERVFIDHREMEYLYQEGENFVFMDTESFEQSYLPGELVADSMKYLKLNDRAKVSFYEGRALAIEVPAAVTLEVTQTEPGFKGDTATNVMKPATLETGLEVKVPPYIEIGEKVKIDTRTGEFLERVNE